MKQCYKEYYLWATNGPQHNFNAALMFSNDNKYVKIFHYYKKILFAYF